MDEDLVEDVGAIVEQLIQKVTDLLNRTVKEHTVSNTSDFDYVEHSDCQPPKHWSHGKVDLPICSVDGIRKAKSIGSIASSDAGDWSSATFSDSDDDIIHGMELIGSEDDSDAEFEKYLAQSAAQRHRNYLKEHHPIPSVKKARKNAANDSKNVDEYEELPSLENLTIKCDERAKMQKIGTVLNTVGVIVMVQSEVRATLNLDTILFDKDRKTIGPICDIIGTMASAIYCIRFNSKEEAAAISIGTDVFCAPNDKRYTNSLLERDLATPWRRADWRTKDGEDVEDEDEMVFSDDEKEREYYAKKRAKDADYCNAMGIRKRNRNRVQFNLPFTEASTSHTKDSLNQGQGGRGRGRGGGHRGRGGWRRGNQNNWQNSSRDQDPIESAPIAQAPQPSGALSSTQKKPDTQSAGASDNPYAEFGCYGDSTPSVFSFRK